MLILLLTILITKFRQRNLQRQIKWQEFLAGKGIGFRTRILEIIQKSCSLKGYKKFCMRAMLRVNGKIVCRKMHTVMTTENTLHIGDQVLIRYEPNKPTRVLVYKKNSKQTSYLFQS